MTFRRPSTFYNSLFPLTSEELQELRLLKGLTPSQKGLITKALRERNGPAYVPKSKALRMATARNRLLGTLSFCSKLGPLISELTCGKADLVPEDRLYNSRAGAYVKRAEDAIKEAVLVLRACDKFRLKK